MKALVIAVYIGSLPSNFPLWLRSAACNPQVDFLVVSDQAEPALPGNVRFQKSDMAQLREIFSREAGFEVALTSPYKLNDFKPMFWLLAGNIADYAYWGYCDLDMMFGDLSRLLDRTMGHFDMILSHGHLRFLRNDERTRQAWRDVAQPRGWRDVLADPVTWGMDEHRGINRVFAGTERTWFSDPAMIADIDPAFRQLRLAPRFRNYCQQAFSWEKGRVFREVKHGRRQWRDEYIYVHFQKRMMPIDPPALTADVIDIGPGGFTARLILQGSEAALHKNRWHWPNRKEARNLLREWWRRLLGRPSIHDAVGTLPDMPE